MKVVLAIFTWDKQAVINDKEGHYIMIKGLIQQKDIIFVSIYKPNIEALKYIKQILRLTEIDSNTVIVGYFSVPFSSINTSSREKLKKPTIVFKWHVKPDELRCI